LEDIFARGNFFTTAPGPFDALKRYPDLRRRKPLMYLHFKFSGYFSLGADLMLVG